MAVTPDIQAPQGRVSVVYNVPTLHLQAEQAAVNVTMRETAANIAVGQLFIMAVVDGRVAQPLVRASTFTLDGHDFYMLRLGDAETLLYDASTQQWVDWDGGGLPFWRANCAINWIGAQSIGYVNGNTDIVVGDDTWGLLYFLDPTQPYDDYPDAAADPSFQQVPYNRVVMAQALAKSREFVPCYAVFLSGDNYGITASDFTPFVQLEISDDQGNTFTNVGVITVEPNTYDNDYRWTSLGQFGSPGRLFRITDNGILTRIDSLDMNDE